MNRAYAFIEKKNIDTKRRTFTGVATTPETDRMGDTVNPMGAKFRNPVVLLHQHRHDAPIGTVKLLKPTPRGIEFEAEIPVVKEPGLLKDRVDLAWDEISSGIVNSVSIGFAPIKFAYLDQGGIEFQEIEIYELSTVSVPANAGAMITAVKSMDKQLRKEAGVAEPDEVTIPKIKTKDLGSQAALGTKQPVVVRLATPGVSGKSVVVSPRKENPMATKSIADQIAEFEETLRVKKAARTAIMTKSTEEGTTLDAEQEEEFDGLTAEVKAIEKHLGRLNEMQGEQVSTAKPVGEVKSVADASANRAGSTVQVKAQPKLAPGVGFARLAKVKALSAMNHEPATVVAERMYGSDSDVLAIVKAAVTPGSNVSGNWASALTGAESTTFADFAAFLRPATILGKFGQGGIPDLRRVPFRERLISQTGGGDGYWVGEGKPKPLTSFNFAGTTITPMKVANIAVLTVENIRSSNPSSELIVRDALRDALVATQDTSFIDPTNAGVTDVKPASITSGAPAIAASGIDADAVRLSVRAVFQKFIDADNPPESGVWIMSTTNALALSMVVNPLGQREFPGITMNGGTFEGMPVIASRYAGKNVVLVNASDIYEADEGEITVDMSREASLEMLDGSLTQNGAAGTGASLVSLWQNNLVGLLAEKTVAWRRRRTSAVAYLTNVNWGGAVPNS